MRIGSRTEFPQLYGVTEPSEAGENLVRRANDRNIVKEWLRFLEV